jgi:hypothetical protein
MLPRQVRGIGWQEKSRAPDNIPPSGRGAVRIFLVYNDRIGIKTLIFCELKVIKMPSFNARNASMLSRAAMGSVVALLFEFPARSE